MTNAKRPILLQVRSLHETSSNHHTHHQSNRHSLEASDELDSGRSQLSASQLRNARAVADHYGLPSPSSPPPRMPAPRPAVATRSMILPTCDRNTTTATRPKGLRCSVPVNLSEHMDYCSPSSSSSCSSSSCRSSYFSSKSNAYDHVDSFSPSSSSASSFPSPSASSSASSTNGSIESDSPSLILPYLYVGDQAQTQLDTISSLNISYILSLQSLPKFLSNSPQSSPPQTVDKPPNDAKVRLQTLNGSSSSTTTYAAAPYYQPTVAAGKADGEQTSLSSKIFSNDSLESNDRNLDNNIRHQSNDEKTTAETNNTTHTTTKQKNPNYDIIDGGDGDLLPSANSSKDYLVRMHRLIKGKCINISDTFEQLLDKFFDETHNFIEEARRNKCNVLVHCKAGISRSPTIAIAYLMKWKRLQLQDAYNFVKRCRPQISPNLNFMGQLVSYERQLLRCSSQLPSPTSSCLASPIILGESGKSTATTEGNNMRVPSKSSPAEEHRSRHHDSYGASSSMLDNEKEPNVRSHQHKRARVREFFKHRNHNKKSACILGHDT